MMAYGMSKAALEMMTRAIVAECSAPRFRCISLRPGIFDTGMQAYARTRDPAEFPSVALFRGFKDNGLSRIPPKSRRRSSRSWCCHRGHGRC
jgi:NAD(P)-dependent dehydrogenase (short-subunit alcohol dehydrogenase family)